jgi:hypothetical protein
VAWREIIVTLNSLGVGDLDGIRRKLETVSSEVRGQGEEELAARLADASAALDRGDLQEYRRILSFVVSRMGHLRD